MGNHFEISSHAQDLDCNIVVKIKHANHYTSRHIKMFILYLRNASTPYYTKLHYTTPNCTTLHQTTLPYTTSLHITPNHTTSNHTTPHSQLHFTPTPAQIHNITRELTHTLTSYPKSK